MKFVVSGTGLERLLRRLSKITANDLNHIFTNLSNYKVAMEVDVG